MNFPPETVQIMTLVLCANPENFSNKKNYNHQKFNNQFNNIFFFLFPFFHKKNRQNARNIVGTRVVNASACNKNNNDESTPSSQDIVLAPPPEFSDSVCTNVKCLSSNNPGQAANMTGRSVRIVGAVPKLSRLQSH